MAESFTAANALIMTDYEQSISEQKTFSVDLLVIKQGNIKKYFFVMFYEFQKWFLDIYSMCKFLIKSAGLYCQLTQNKK